MKKIIIFLMTLFLGLFFLTPTKVFAFLEEYTPEEWYNHITQFDKGYAYGAIFYKSEGKFAIRVYEEPSGDIFLDDVVYDVEDLIYFEPQLHDVILHWVSNDFYVDYYYLGGSGFIPALENTIGLTNFSGKLFWNFEEQYWQMVYYNSSDYIEDEEFTFEYQFTEFDGSERPRIVRIYFTYPIVVFEDIEIPIEIYFQTAQSDTDTIESISFYDQQFDVSIARRERDTVTFFVDSNYVSDKIRLTYLEYTFMGTLKTKNITIDMPVFVYTSEVDYYKYRIAILNDKIQELQDALELEFDRGYDEGYDVGYDEGYDKGLSEGDYDVAYEAGFKAGQKSKLAQNNEAFYNGIEKWLVPAIITVIALGGFVTIAARKRRDE